MYLIDYAGKLSIAQEHFDLLARMHARRTGGKTLRHGIATDAVATPKNGQGAQ